MKKNYTAKCGCNCFHCPTYKKNIRTIEDRRRCSSGWEKYLNIKLAPEKLRACDGCSLTDSVIGNRNVACNPQHSIFPVWNYTNGS